MRRHRKGLTYLTDYQVVPQCSEFVVFQLSAETCLLYIRVKEEIKANLEASILNKLAACS